jgi:hypothetical protein
MLKQIGAILISIIICSCSNPKEDKQKINKTSLDSNLARKTKQEIERDNYWNRLLINLDEPDLKTTEKSTYRFMLWQAFDSCLVLFRVEKDSSNNVTLTTKYYLQAHPDGTGKDTVLEVLKRNLTLKDWKEIEDKSDESYFWTLEGTDNPERHLLDGSGWTIEGKRFPDYPSEEIDNQFKGYTMVYRRCPYKGSFHDFGVTIAKMSNQLYGKRIY